MLSLITYYTFDDLDKIEVCVSRLIAKNGDVLLVRDAPAGLDGCVLSIPDHVARFLVDLYDLQNKYRVDVVPAVPEAMLVRGRISGGDFALGYRYHIFDEPDIIEALRREVQDD